MRAVLGTRALRVLFTPTFGGELDALRFLKPWVVFPMQDGGNEGQKQDSQERTMKSTRKNQVKKLSLGMVAFSCLLAALAFSQAEKSRLAPENASEARLNKLQPPDTVMGIIGAAAGMTIAEIGAGRGRYVVHLADRVGPDGKVYAEDIDAEALRHLAERCRRGGFANVETILGDLADPKLPPGALDLIFVISSYHHFGDPVALMRKARPALKAGGRLAIAEWVPEKDGRGEGTTPEKMTAQMEEAGFALERIDKSLEANELYIYLFRSRPD